MAIALYMERDKMTEICKFVSNDNDELIKCINEHATDNYEDVQQVVTIEKTTIEDVAVWTAVVVFRRRKL